MNRLQVAIEGQYRRVEAWTGDPTSILGEAKDEITSVATPKLTEEILRDHDRVKPEQEMHYLHVAQSLGKGDTLEPFQGYVGGILRQGDDMLVFGHSLAGGIKTNDPIQQEMGETFYPPMMWAKALRAAAYNNRPEAAATLSMGEYLAKLGLTLGCNVTQDGGVIGATGFMPGPKLQRLAEVPVIGEHMQTEPTEVFRLSGLSDQAVVQPIILGDSERFSRAIITAGGSLN